MKNSLKKLSLCVLFALSADQAFAGTKNYSSDVSEIPSTKGICMRVGVCALYVLLGKEIKNYYFEKDGENYKHHEKSASEYFFDGSITSSVCKDIASKCKGIASKCKGIASNKYVECTASILGAGAYLLFGIWATGLMKIGISCWSKCIG